MNTNIKQHFTQFLKRKNKGWAFAFAVMMAATTLMMIMLIYQKEKAHTIKETMQDALTSSALGSISVDYLTYGISEDIVFYNKDTDKAYENLCKIRC